MDIVLQQHFGVNMENEIHANQEGTELCEILISSPSHEASFAIDGESLASIFEANNAEYLQQFEGIEGIAAALKTNILTGVHGDDDDLCSRREVFGTNQIVEGVVPHDTKSLYMHTVEVFKETTTILILCCAILSIVLGMLIYGAKKGWYDGAVLFLDILITVFVKWCKERKLFKGSMSDNIEVEEVDVLRDGRLQQIHTSQVVVGDVLCLKTGDMVPADGLFINGSSSLKLDEDDSELLIVDRSQFPSIFAGATVVDGDCNMLVILVGENTRWSKMMGSIESCGSNSLKDQLLIRIDKLSSCMERIAISFFLILLVVQLLFFFTRHSSTSDDGNLEREGVNITLKELITNAARIIDTHGGTISRLVAISCVLLTGIREGLPFGVLISLCYSKRVMEFDHAMVNDLQTCTAIGLVTTVCVSKTGDLSLKQMKMKMAELWIGQELVNDAERGVAQEVLCALHEGVGLNTSGAAEDAQLCWARMVLGVDTEELKQSSTVIKNEAFDFDKTCSLISLKRKGEEGKFIVHKHLKGAADTVLPICSAYYDINGTIKSMDNNQRILFNEISNHIAADSLHCIAFAYKQEQIVVEQEQEQEHVILQQQQQEEEEEEKEDESFKLTGNGMTLLGLVGFKNPYSLELKQAVRGCQDAGVEIKLVLGDDPNIGRFIAMNSEIIRPEEDIDRVVVEASEFRDLSDEERQSRVDEMRVMVNSTPFDKLLMVQCLRQKHKAVAVIGSNTRDLLSLKEADVGLFVGDKGNQTPKESYDMVILDKSFTTVTSIVSKGRCVYNNIQKFIQLHLTVNMAGITLNFIAAIPSGETLLSPFQVLWVSLIVNTLAALALATDPPSRIPPVMMPPVHGTSFLTTNTMWRNILVQVLYQTTVLLTLQFKGKDIFHVNDQTVVHSMIFNSYVLCQVFVLLNAREIEKKQVLEKLHRNRGFLGVVVAIIFLQTMFMVVATRCNPMMRLDLQKWCICVGISALSLPIGWVAKGIKVSM